MAAAHTAEAVVGSSHTLEHPVNRFGRMNLYDPSHATDVNSEF